MMVCRFLLHPLLPAVCWTASRGLVLESWCRLGQGEAARWRGTWQAMCLPRQETRGVVDR